MQHENANASDPFDHVLTEFAHCQHVNESQTILMVNALFSVVLFL